MLDIAAGEKRHYRRGLVMGFTVAEALLLILFGLLLALASILFSKDTEAERLTEEVRRLEQEAAIAAELSLRFPEGADISFDAWFAELVSVRTRLDTQLDLVLVLRGEIADLRNQLRELEHLQSRLEGMEGDDALRAELQRLAAIGAGLEEAFGPDANIDELEPVLEIAQKLNETLPRPGDPEREAAIGEMAALAERIGALEAEIAGLREEIADLEAMRAAMTGQLENARRRLADGGLGKPACWAAQVGTPQYIFDVALGNTGMYVLNNQVEGREEEQAQLRIPARLYNRTVSMGDFSAMTAGVFAYAEQQDCRFFVRVYDFTGSTDKDLYKALLRSVENYFYKYEVENNSSWRGPDLSVNAED